MIQDRKYYLVDAGMAVVEAYWCLLLVCAALVLAPFAWLARRKING